VEAVLEYFKIPHTHQFIKLSEVYQSHPAAYTNPQPNIPKHIYYTHPPEKAKNKYIPIPTAHKLTNKPPSYR
jgi:hypothetical protein